MVKPILLLAIIFMSGCAGLTTGIYPYPSGGEVVAKRETMAKLITTDFEAFEEIEGYTPDLGLIGIVVPFIPIGQWKWLTGISKDDLRVSVNLWIKPKSKQVLFDAATLHIDVDGRIYSPSEIKIGSMCGVDKTAILVDKSKPVTMQKEACISFSLQAFHHLAHLFLLLLQDYRRFGTCLIEELGISSDF